MAKLREVVVDVYKSDRLPLVLNRTGKRKLRMPLKYRIDAFLNRMHKKIHGCAFCADKAYLRNLMFVVTMHDKRQQFHFVMDYCPCCGRKLREGI